MRPESSPLIQSHVFQNFLHPSTHGAQNFRSVLQLFSWEKSRITFEKLNRTLFLKQQKFLLRSVILHGIFSALPRRYGRPKKMSRNFQKLHQFF